jgi:hypothetical protein
MAEDSGLKKTRFRTVGAQAAGKQGGCAQRRIKFMSSAKRHGGEIGIDRALARKLFSAQFP